MLEEVDFHPQTCNSHMNSQQAKRAYNTCFKFGLEGKATKQNSKSPELRDLLIELERVIKFYSTCDTYIHFHSNGTEPVTVC